MILSYRTKMQQRVMKPLQMIAAFAVLTGAFAISAQAQAPAQPPKATDHLTVTQWVKPKKQGVFEARVVLPRVGGEMDVVQNAVVSLIGARDTVYSGVTDENGDVEIGDVLPGVYALTVRSEGLVGWQAMHIVGPNQIADESLKSKALIAPAMVTYKKFRELIEPYDEQEYTLDELSTVDVEVEELVGQIRGNEEFMVEMRNGGMFGTIYAATTRFRANTPADRLRALEAAPETRLFLLRDRELVSESMADVSGRFFFRDLTPGIYSLLMVNKDGVGAVTFELIPNKAGDGASLLTTGGYRFVQTSGTQGSFAFQVAPNVPGADYPTQDAITGGGGAGGFGGLGALGALGAAGGGGGGFETTTPNTPGTAGGGN